ncbi:MAG: phosphotransferase [Actinobacteria bacterium]|nr:phosphotransferase [Actinomycetota bacterium]
MQRLLTVLGGITQGVVRVGNTVRRPTGPHTPFVHSLLRHLEEVGFDRAPRVLGVDQQGREIATFIEGHVPPDLATWSDGQLVRAAALIRHFHDATAGTALAGDEEVVCHNDLSPCNTVFVEGMPSAFIDFDEAASGPRSQDLGYAMWLFLDLGPEGVDTRTQGRRMRMMCEAYRIGSEFDAISAIAHSQQATLERSLGRLRAGGPASGVAYAQSSVEWIHGQMAWLDAHRDELEEAMV